MVGEIHLRILKKTLLWFNSLSAIFNNCVLVTKKTNTNDL